MTKHRPVLQLVILSVHLMTSKGQGELEISTNHLPVTCLGHLSNTSKDLSSVCQNLGTQTASPCSVEEIEGLCNGSLGSVNATNMMPSATDMTPSATTFGASEASGQGHLLLLEVVDSLSGRCRATMAASVKQFTSQVSGGCDFLESIRNQLLDSRICPLEDHENLHDLLCRKGENDAAEISDEVRLRHSFLTALNYDVSSSCHDALTSEVVQLTDNLPAGCRKLISMRSRLVADGSCTDLELAKLTKELCGEVQRITDDVNRVLQNDITSKCKVAMTSGTTSIIQKTNEEACDSVKAFKDMLLISDFCTADDYWNLYHVTCGRSNALLLNYLLILLCVLITVV